MKAVYGVDLNKDFMNKDGKFYVNGAEFIKCNVETILNNTSDMLVIGSMDAHPEDDKEFNSFPKHCIIGTDGQCLIPEAVLFDDATHYVVPNNGQGIDIAIAENSWQITFEKQCIDIWDKTDGQPDNLQTLLRYANIEEVYIYGVATDFCVKAAIAGFLSRKYKVTVISDAVAGVVPEACEAVLKQDGIRLITTSEYVSEIKRGEQ